MLLYAAKNFGAIKISAPSPLGCFKHPTRCLFVGV